MSMRTAESEIELENRLRTGRLKLNDLQLNELPDQLFDLHHLTTLHLGENNLTHLDERLAALRDLKTLYLNGNKFEIFPPVVAKLVALEELDVSRNRISSLPPELTKLSELVYLHVSGNPLAGNIAGVEKLPKLRNLVAAQIGATEFPLPVTEVTKLQTLNLTDNSFATIPPEFAKLTNLANLYLTADRLSSPPPEIIARGPHAIINYLRAFDKKGPSFVLREAKLLIVGEGAVGKTCLMNRLISDKFEEHSVTTEGIDINAWEVPDNDGKSFRVNVWDFGGQEIYHSTHQFFLTKRSLYLFLWEARKEENIHSFDYWLSVVSLLGKQAPVLIVMNKADERIKTIDEESLQKEFPNIVSFHRASAKTGLGIADLRKTAVEHVTRLPHVGDVLPASWHDIREALAASADNFMSSRGYYDMCRRFNLDQRQAEYLSQYFHDLGVFLHFRDDHVLRRIVFLKPEWATGAVYKLIDTKSVQDRLGRFSVDELRTIWTDYPEERHVELLELMKKFELCFQIKDSDEFIVPELLGSKAPSFTWDDNDNLHFQYEYDFMPSGILARFIVRTHDLIVGKSYWKNGVLLKRDGNEALITSEPLFRRIKIRIRGPEKALMLALIRREIDGIHQSLNYPSVQETVPCTCSHCSGSAEPYMHNYDYLRRARSRRKMTVECKNSFDDVYIDEILGNVRVAGGDSEGASDRDRNFSGPDTVKLGDRQLIRQFSEGMRTVGIDSGAALRDIVTGFHGLRNRSRELDDLDRLIGMLKDHPDDPKAIHEWVAFCERNGIPLPRVQGRGSMWRLVRVLFGL